MNFQTAPYSQPPTPAVPDAGLSQVGLQNAEATNQAVHEGSGCAICLQQLLIWGRHQLGRGKGHPEAPVKVSKSQRLANQEMSDELIVNRTVPWIYLSDPTFALLS